MSFFPVYPSVVHSSEFAIGTTASVTCREPATAGSITIPASSIAKLPTRKTATGTKVELFLTPTDANPDLYSAPLTGGGTVPGVATFSYLEMVWVELPDKYLNRLK